MQTNTFKIGQTVRLVHDLGNFGKAGDARTVLDAGVTVAGVPFITVTSRDGKSNIARWVLSAFVHSDPAQQMAQYED